MDTLLERYNNLQKLLELNRKLALNETHAVLFGADSSQNSSKSALNETKESVDGTVDEEESVSLVNENEVTLHTSEASRKAPTKVENINKTIVLMEEGSEVEVVDKKKEDQESKSQTKIASTVAATNEDIDTKPSPAKQRRTSPSSALHHSMVVQETNTKSTKIGTPVRVRRSTRRASTIM